MSDRLDELDYYELLQVDAHANADALREAFHEFALRNHPDVYAASSIEKRTRASEIYRRGAEAYRVLLDPELRRAYDHQRAAGHKRYDPELTERAASRAPSALFAARARPFAQKALEASKRGDHKTAKLNLTLALQHDPENPTLKSRLEETERALKA